MTLNETDPHRHFTHISQQQMLQRIFGAVFFSSFFLPMHKNEKQRNLKKKTFFLAQVYNNKSKNEYFFSSSMAFCNIFVTLPYLYSLWQYRWPSYFDRAFGFLVAFFLSLFLFLVISGKSNRIDTIDHGPQHRVSTEI